MLVRSLIFVLAVAGISNNALAQSNDYNYPDRTRSWTGSDGNDYTAVQQGGGTTVESSDGWSGGFGGSSAADFESAVESSGGPSSSSPDGGN